MAEITKSKYTDLIGETITDFPFEGIEISFDNLKKQEENNEEEQEDNVIKEEENKQKKR